MCVSIRKRVAQALVGLAVALVSVAIIAVISTLLIEARTGLTADVRSKVVAWTNAPLKGNEDVLVLPEGVVYQEKWDPTGANALDIVPTSGSIAATFKVVGPTQYRLTASGRCGFVLEIEPLTEASRITVQVDRLASTEQTTLVSYSLGLPVTEEGDPASIICPAAPISLPLLGVKRIDIGQQVRAPNLPQPGYPPLWFGSTVEGKLSAYSGAWLSSTDVTVAEKMVAPGELLSIVEDPVTAGALIWGVIEREPAGHEHAFRIIAQAASPKVTIFRAGQSQGYNFAPAIYQAWQAQPLMLIAWFFVTATATFIGAAFNVYQYLQGRSARAARFGGPGGAPLPRDQNDAPSHILQPPSRDG